jgi:hypothetical protein
MFGKLKNELTADLDQILSVTIKCQAVNSYRGTVWEQSAFNYDWQCLIQVSSQFIFQFSKH